MKGVVYHGPGEVALADLPVPRPTHPRDAVVRVTRAAICGTDLHPYRGEIPAFAAGTVLGHEFAGVLEQAGPEVPFPVGQRVFASDVIACGRCDRCRRGWHYQCHSVTLFGYSTVVGESVAGGQAEYVRVPFADVVLAATPDDVTDEQALFVGDALTTAFAAARAAVEPGHVVAVVGGGPVGLLSAMCAHVAGACAVVVADPLRSRRDLAVSLGLRAAAPDELAAAVAATGVAGADSVIEAVGSDSALRAALTVAGPRSTVVAVGAHHNPAMAFPTDLAFARELALRFVVGDPISLRAPVLALVRSGRIDPTRLVTHRLPLVEAPLAYRLFERGGTGKVVLLVGEASGDAP